MRGVDLFLKSSRRILKFLLNWESKAEIAQAAEAKAREARYLPWKHTRELQQIEFVKIGKYTYGLTPDSISRPTKEAPVTIGSFCSFAPGVIILAHADHPTSLPSTYPFKTLFCNARSAIFDPTWLNYDAITKGAINIGHDVWVGQNAIILSGVTIGNGVVIGAGAVVAKDIPAYAIAVGNPAKIVRFRFTPAIIEGIEKAKWWSLSDEEIDKLLPLLYSTPEELINFLNKNVE